MSSLEVYEEAEVVSETGITLFGTNDPLAVIEAATRLAQPLAQLIRDRKLATNISGREHVRIEGWTLLGSMLGVFPVTEWTRPVTDSDGKQTGWEARVSAQRADGSVVGAAEAECLGAERNWSDRDDYALKSMAQTRAASKALRLPLGFVMQLAGFDPTPAEEIPAEGFKRESKAYPLSGKGGNCPACGAGVWDNLADNEADDRKPAFKCSNKQCQGGGPKDKSNPDGERWPWATWSRDFFDTEVQGDGPGDVIDRMTRLVAKELGGDEHEAWDTAEAVIYEAANALGIVWPDPGLPSDKLNELFKAAKAGL